MNLVRRWYIWFPYGPKKKGLAKLEKQILFFVTIVESGVDVDVTIGTVDSVDTVVVDVDVDDDDVSIIGLIVEVDIYSTVYMSAIFILISGKTKLYKILFCIIFNKVIL